MIEKFCLTKVKGNESKTFREHAKTLLEERKQFIEELERELNEFKAVKEKSASRKAIRDGMIADLQAKWALERSLMVQAAEKLGNMLACSTQEEAVKLWGQWEQ